MTELRGLLERIVRLLDAANVPFMIAGSFASAAHGLPRTTQDLDIVVAPPDPDALDFFVRSMARDEYYVDVEAAQDALRQFARRMKLSLLDVPVFVASPEDTIVAKLEWSKHSGGFRASATRCGRDSSDAR